MSIRTSQLPSMLRSLFTLKSNSILPQNRNLSIPKLVTPFTSYSTNSQSNDGCQSTVSHSSREFIVPKVYKPKLPSRYGYKQDFFDGGLLPRIDGRIRTLPNYKPSDTWTLKKALFGQNDYIDILGDGSIQPYETIQGPRWLVGFHGHEYARTVRRLKFTGRKLGILYPKLNADLNKRIKYLYKQHNQKRKSHRYRPKHW